MLRGIASVAPTCNELFSPATRTEHTRDTGRAPRSTVPFLHLRTGAQVLVPASEPSLPLACGLPRMIWIPVCFVLSLSRLFFPRLIAYSHSAIRSPRLSRISNSSFLALRCAAVRSWWTPTLATSVFVSRLSPRTIFYELPRV